MRDTQVLFPQNVVNQLNLLRNYPGIVNQIVVVAGGDVLLALLNEQNQE